MTDTASNKATMRAAIEAWDACKASDTSCWTDIFADDVTLYSLARGGAGLGFTKAGTGRAAVAAYFEGLTGTFAMNHYRAQTYVAEGDTVVATGECSWTGRDSGQTFETPFALIATFQGGKIVEIHEFYDTARVSAALTAA